MRRKLKILFIILGLLLACLILYELVKDFLPDFKLFIEADEKKGEKLLLNHIRSHGIGTALLLMLLMSVFTSIPGFPIGFIGIFSGVCYGPIIASIMNITGITFGNLLNYGVIKKFKLIKNSSNRWVQMISKNKHPYISIAISYMIPVIPSVLVNYSASSLNISFGRIVVLNIIGALPTSLLYAFGGDALFKGNKKLCLILLLCVGLLFLLIILLNRSKKEKKKRTERQTQNKQSS